MKAGGTPTLRAMNEIVMPIKLERIRRDIRTIAGFTETPKRGASRPTFSKPWRDACNYVIAEARKAGCDIRIDAAGNVHARHKSQVSEKVWLSGSHIDSVPHGGDYDGVVGIVCALEVLRSAKDLKKPVPLELIIFADEEGTTFELGMLGSRAWVGELSAKELSKLTNRDGKSYLEAGKPCGVNPAKLKSDRLDSSRYHGLIELHIEQGPGMWKRNQPVAVVTAIAGRQQFLCTIYGQANHAGSTSMSDRADALTAAAEIIVSLEDLPVWSNDEVLTVGKISATPNAVNVVPGRVEFTIDFRGPTNAGLTSGEQAIRDIIQAICNGRGLKHSLVKSESQIAAPMDASLVEHLTKATRKITEKKPITTVSGALHDSAIVAKYLPTAMLFIASKDGISHNPAELSRMEDIALGARILEELVKNSA
jgi:allantoate deiminase